MILPSRRLELCSKSIILVGFRLKFKLLLLKFKIQWIDLLDKIFMLILKYSFELLNFLSSELCRMPFECIFICPLSVKIRQLLILLNLLIRCVFINSLSCNSLVVIWRNILKSNPINSKFKFFKWIHFYLQC